MRKRKLYLAFATVQADDLSAWAFVARHDNEFAKGLFLHSAAGATREGTTFAAHVGLGSGLRWMVDQGHADGKLVLTIPSNSHAERLAVTTTADCPEGWAAMRGKIYHLLSQFKSVKVREANRWDIGADWLARFGWESATLRDFPHRPTKRQVLPGLMPAEANS